MIEHAPTPWATENMTGDCDLIYSLGAEYGIARTLSPDEVDNARTCEETQANADFIVRACNSHDQLLAACELWNEFATKVFCTGFGLEINGRLINHTDLNKAWDATRAVIAEVKGKT